MKQIITRDYYIELGELREIIANYFENKTGESVALCNIDVDVQYRDGCFAEFKAVHINIQKEV